MARSSRRHRRPRVRPARFGRRKWRWWPIARLGLLVGLLAGAWWFVSPPPPGEWQTVGTRFGTCGMRGRPPACVTDGDTVTLGFGESARRIRLKGFDAPEVAGACPAEAAKAAEATAALTEWLNRGPFEWDGGASPPRDQYGRELRSARRKLPDGAQEDLAEWMVARGLAEGEAIWERRDWCR